MFRIVKNHVLKSARSTQGAVPTRAQPEHKPDCALLAAVSVFDSGDMYQSDPFCGTCSNVPGTHEVRCIPHYCFVTKCPAHHPIIPYMVHLQLEASPW